MGIRWALAREMQRENRKREKKNIVKEIDSRRNKQRRFSRRTLILVSKIFILCFLILNATQCRSSVARDMKTPDVGFRIQLVDRWGSRKPSGIISDKDSKGSIRCRASERKILYVDLATNRFSRVSEKNWKICLGHMRGRENLMRGDRRANTFNL